MAPRDDFRIVLLRALGVRVELEDRPRRWPWLQCWWKDLICVVVVLFALWGAGAAMRSIL